MGASSQLFWGPGTADVSSCGDWFFTIHRGPDCFDAHAVDVWDVSGCCHYRRLQSASSSPIFYAVFSPDSSHVLAVSCCHEITVWSLGPDWVTYILDCDDFIDMVDFSPDGVHVLTMSFGNVCLRAADAPKSRLCCPQRNARQALFAPGGKIMVIDEHRGIEMWSAAGALCWTAADKQIEDVFCSTAKRGSKFWDDALDHRRSIEALFATCSRFQ